MFLLTYIVSKWIWILALIHLDTVCKNDHYKLYSALISSVLSRCWLGDSKSIRPVETCFAIPESRWQSDFGSSSIFWTAIRPDFAGNVLELAWRDSRPGFVWKINTEFSVFVQSTRFWSSFFTLNSKSQLLPHTLGGHWPPQTEAPKTHSGERRRRNNQGAEDAQWDWVWGEVPPPNYGVWGSVVSSPQESPAGNAFWRILKATERSSLHLYAEILGAKPRLGDGAIATHFPDVEPLLAACHVNVISAFSGLYYSPLVTSRKLYT